MFWGSVQVTLASVPNESHLLAELSAALAKKKMYSQAHPFHQIQAAIKGLRYQF
jgi:hypothetical protein